MTIPSNLQGPRHHLGWRIVLLVLCDDALSEWIGIFFLFGDRRWGCQWSSS